MKKSNLAFIITTLLCTTPMVIFANPTPQQAMIPKADIFVIPDAKELNISLKYPALIEPFQKIQVVSRVMGTLKEKHFQEGQQVQKGDLLYTIEDDIYKAKLEASQATLHINKASLENAQRNWERALKLYKTKSISEEKKDEALTNFEQAKASYALAQAQLQQSKIDFDYTKVKAPISGTVGLKKVDIGDFVTHTPPTELVTITANDKVFLDFSIPMSDFANIQKGLWSIPENKKIEVSILKDEKETGKIGVVDFIDINIDRSTSTVKMRAVVDNSDRTLMAGDFVRAQLQGIVQKNVITIPQKALLQNPMGTIVFIEENGVAAIRPVVVGKETGEYYVVAGGALKSGDRVIVNNFFRVKPGQPVQVDKIINQ